MGGRRRCGGSAQRPVVSSRETVEKADRDVLVPISLTVRKKTLRDEVVREAQLLLQELGREAVDIFCREIRPRGGFQGRIWCLWMVKLDDFARNIVWETRNNMSRNKYRRNG